MEPWIIALLGPCILLAGAVAGALAVRGFYLPSTAMQLGLEQVAKQVKDLLLVELPRIEGAVQQHLETAQGMLDSAETKRKRAAARRQHQEAPGQEPDNAEPWNDPNLPPQARRAALESLVNRSG